MEVMKQIYVLNDFDETALPIMKVNSEYVLENGITHICKYKKENPSTKVLLDAKIGDFDYHLIENEKLKDIDFITVQATSQYKTISYVLHKAHEANMEVVMDVSGVHNLNDVLENLMLYGVDYVRVDNDDLIKLKN